MFGKGRAFSRLCLFAWLLFRLLTPLVGGCVLGCDVMVHVGVHLAGKEALVAVEELCTLLVENQLAQSPGIHIITELRVNGAHVDLHILVIGASETAVATLQAYRWFPKFLTHLHLLSHRRTALERLQHLRQGVLE